MTVSCISDLEAATKHTFTKYALDTKLWGPVDMHKAGLPSRMAKTGCWDCANMNLMKYNKDKCKFLYLRRNNPL